LELLGAIVYKYVTMSPRCDDEDDDEKKKMPEMPDPLTEKFLKTRQIILSGEINKDLEKIHNGFNKSNVTVGGN